VNDDSDMKDFVERYVNSYINSNNDSLTSQGDGNSRPDPNTGTNLHNSNAKVDIDANADAQDHCNGAEASPPKPPVSEARLHANRENAKKSTGPKTVQGKAHSSRNALTHGLLAKTILFRPDGTPINEDLHQLWEELHDKYGAGDVITDLRIQTVIVECWRQGKALSHEAKGIDDFGHFYGKGVGNFQRYRTASQRALEKNLEQLEKLSPPPSEAVEDEPEADVSAVTPENPPQTPRPPSGEKSYSTSKAEEVS
jgi:hypothetical protein